MDSFGGVVEATIGDKLSSASLHRLFATEIENRGFGGTAIAWREDL